MKNNKPLSCIIHNQIASDAGSLQFGGYSSQAKGMMHHPMRELVSYSLVYIMSDGGVYENEKHVITDLKAGSLFLLKPGVAHRYGPQKGKTWEEAFIFFYCPLFETLQNKKIVPSHHLLGSLEPIHHWRNVWIQFLNRFKTSDSNDVFSLLSELIYMVSKVKVEKAEGQLHAWQQKAIHFIRQHNKEVINFPKLAQHLKINYETFRKKFKENFGISPLQYQKKSIMEEASQLLSTSDLDIKEIATKLQFCDEFHFSKQFKKYVGISPSDYKRLKT